ncbi:hypothetical protein BU16DRAFT_211828 [Lophium mytilinum]|uniref:Uncharacterized protein n=1 Tax=Lophium mytilinum TaxID=390894 RepID=A0A6A6RBR3_9PEZI|nr:hypothetical protein BU16DRAFT_211828 [Lophium mytilinum]
MDLVDMQGLTVYFLFKTVIFDVLVADPTPNLSPKRKLSYKRAGFLLLVFVLSQLSYHYIDSSFSWSQILKEQMFSISTSILFV